LGATLGKAGTAGSSPDRDLRNYGVVVGVDLLEHVDRAGAGRISLWFEEGVALRFGLKKAPLDPALKKANRCVIKPPWKLVLNAFNKLNPTDAQIAAIRERADRKLFDAVTKELIIDVCGVRRKVAEDLCQRLQRNTR
jgi:hypothetical protein